MRELRQDVAYNLESPKEELDQIDEIKIEEVLMGLKGLKQEEVFSFLGKNNFTPAETEMSSAGLGNYDQLTSVDTSEIEQLQLSFNVNFEGMQANHGHSIPTNSYHVPKRFKPKIDTDLMHKTIADYSKTLCEEVSSSNWSSVKKEKPSEDLQLQQRFPPWPRYTGVQDYLLTDYPVETLREEEIVATNIAEEMICTSNVDDDEQFKSSEPTNSYVIQTPVDGVDVVDKPKPIKLLIKRLESEDETAEIPVTRVKSKRTRQPSVRLEEISPPPKRRRSIKKTSTSRAKAKTQVPMVMKRKQDSFEELDFPFVNTVHQDDDFVYPSLDLSDDEQDDVYSFNQGDDETWTPKMKMKMNNLKNERPARDRKRNNAVAKCLEAAALKRTDTHSSNIVTSNKCSRKTSSKKKTVNTSTQKSKTDDGINDLIIDEDYRCNRLSTSRTSLPDNAYSLPSTSKTVFSSVPASYDDIDYHPLSCADLSSRSEKSAAAMTTPQKAKSKTKCVKKIRKIIPPKTCKLVQTPPGAAKQSSISLQLDSTKKSVKDNLSMASSCTPSSEKKSPSATYITKRGKPKKGMATAKQRLGKILKMHKMFF